MYVTDPLCQHRYHCTHEAGVHSVGLTWFKKLQMFLESGEFTCSHRNLENIIGLIN